MRGPARRARVRLLRLGRLLLGRNKLRRRCDRIEGAVIVLLLAAFITASAWSAGFAGHIYRSEHAAMARVVHEPGDLNAEEGKRKAGQR